jgi:hypothetical protein
VGSDAVPTVDPLMPPGDGGPAVDPVVLGVPVTSPGETAAAADEQGSPSEQATPIATARPPTPTSSPTGTAVALGIVTVLVALSVGFRRRKPGA